MTPWDAADIGAASATFTKLTSQFDARWRRCSNADDQFGQSALMDSAGVIACISPDHVWSRPGPQSSGTAARGGTSEDASRVVTGPARMLNWRTERLLSHLQI
jgi:hypothetical protein